jgi:hypothetical protein
MGKTGGFATDHADFDACDDIASAIYNVPIELCFTTNCDSSCANL